MRIMGIDPGVTTGVCLFIDGEFSEGVEVTSGALGVMKYLTLNKPDHIVMEDFIVCKLPAEVKVPLKLIGVVEYEALIRNIPVTMQSPSILHFMLARAKGLSSSPHIRSASAHVMYYLDLCKRGNR